MPKGHVVLTHDQMLRRLALFLRRHAMLVADAIDSNYPWTLIEQLDRFEEEAMRREKRGVK